MRLSQIDDFLAVANTGSLRSAARMRKVSQPGLTKSIRSLEAELRVPLFLRTNKGVVPTDFGRAFLARARVVQAEIARAEAEFAHMTGGDAGLVSFGFGPAVAATIVPDAVASFRAEHPRARLRLVEGLAHVTVQFVREGVIDFALAPKQRPAIEYRDVTFRPLFRPRRIVVGRARHPLARARTTEAFSKTHWITLEPRDAFERLLRAAGIDAFEVVQCESMSTAFALIERTDMLAVLPAACLALPGASKSLEKMDCPLRFASWTFGIFTRADAPLTPLANALVARVIRAARLRADDYGP